MLRKDSFGIDREVGEIWFDQAGNSCYFRDNGTISCQTVNNEPSLTSQADKDSCDFNLIYAKYSKTGLMTNWRTDQPMFGDFSDAVDYHTSVFRLQEAQDNFMLLPASIRTRFSNDPGLLIDFLADPNNRPEAIKLGLVASPQDNQDPQGVTTPPAQDGG